VRETVAVAAGGSGALASAEVQALLDAMMVGVIAIDNQALITHINKTAETLLGLDRRACLGRPIRQMVPSTELPGVLETGKPSSGKVTVQGTTIMSIRHPITNGGSITGAVAVFQDTTQLEALSHELDTVKQLYRELEAIFDASYDELFVVDAEGVTLRVNSACERLEGVKPQDLIGRNVKDLAQEGFFYPSIAEEVVRTKQRITTVQDTRMGKKVITTSNPVFNEKGEVVRVVSNCRDITEMNYLRQQLEHSERLTRHFSKELAKVTAKLMGLDDVVAYSVPMKRCLELAERVADVDSTVLLLGESGVGKDVLARVIHRLSHRSEGPFIKVNCGAIPEQLLESELFGYEPGAFTGARRDGKAGLFEVADGGTLFLDEVAEIPMPLQVKLLNAIQERQVRRIGGHKATHLDVRLIAATNQDLPRRVEEGFFRQDLFYRLNVVPIEIPPLRERPADIPPLIFHFLDKLKRNYGIPKTFSSRAMDALLAYKWPGNVREVENLLERLVVTTDGDVVDLDDIPSHIRGDSAPQGAVTVGDVVPLEEAVRETERQLLLLALKMHGTSTAAARALGIHHSTVIRKARKMGLWPLKE